MACPTARAKPAPKSIPVLRRPTSQKIKAPNAEATISGFIRVLERIDAAKSPSYARQNKAIPRAPEGQIC